MSQINSGAGPSRPRADRLRRIYYAVTVADDVLRDIAAGREVEPERVRVARGLLAEWRLESA